MVVDHDSSEVEVNSFLTTEGCTPNFTFTVDDDLDPSEVEVNSLEAMAGGLGLEAKFKAPLESILIGDSFLI